MEIKHGLKEIIQQPAVFEGYKKGQLLYSVAVDNIKYTFPVDVVDKTIIQAADFDNDIPEIAEIKMSADIGESQFDGYYSKAITLMRYINKAIKAETIRFETLQATPE